MGVSWTLTDATGTKLLLGPPLRLITNAIFGSKPQITLSILTEVLIVPQSISDLYAVHSLPHLTLAILADRAEFPLVQTSELDHHEI